MIWMSPASCAAVMSAMCLSLGATSKATAPSAKLSRLIRDELCSVPIGEIKKFLEGNGADGKARQAWLGGMLSRRRMAQRSKQTKSFLDWPHCCSTNCGGYDERSGWDRRGQPRVVSPVEPKEATEPEAGQDDEPLTFHWKYTANARRRIRVKLKLRLAGSLRLSQSRSQPSLTWCNDLIFATQHHDLGKMSPGLSEEHCRQRRHQALMRR